MSAAIDAEAMLRSAGLRVTRPRTAVLAAVHDHPHTDTDFILRAVRGELGRVSTQAVYDVLRALTAAGLVRRIESAASVALYEAQTGDNHHHLVCRRCGDIVDVDCATGEAPCMHVTDDHGYAIDEADVVYRGLCPSCSTVSGS